MIRAVKLPFKEAFGVYDNDKYIGCCDFDESNGEILGINGVIGEFELDLAIRSVIAYFQNKGIKKTICRCEHLSNFLLKIGFIKKDNYYEIDNDRFISCKCCGTH